MALYEYRCPTYPTTRVVTSQRGDRITAWCEECERHHEFVRVFAVNMAPVMQEHFNKAVGKPISSMSQMKRELRELSGRREEETGIPHNFQPCDYRDRELLGVTGEGIHESNVERSKRGEPLLPEIK